MPLRLISVIKNLFVKKEFRPYSIHFGVFRGLKMWLDLRNSFQVYLGLWERETFKFIKKAAKICEWYIDIGAGKGEHVLFFLKESTAEPIFALEPQVKETDILYRNLLLNKNLDTNRVTIINKYVGTLKNHDFVTLDSLKIDRNKYGFIKIDVDGLEMDVLRSGSSLISNGKLSLLIETHSKLLEDECLIFLQRNGYTCRIIRNALWRLFIPERRPCSHNRWILAERP